MSQAIGLAAAPILTRLYSPDAFGQAAMFAALVVVVSGIACFNYEYAVVSPKSNRIAANLLIACLGLSTAFCLTFVLPISKIYGEAILQSINMYELVESFWLIFPCVWITSWYTALNFWNTRTRHFTRLSISRVVGTSVSTGGALIYGYSGQAIGSHMIIAQACGQAFSTIVLFIQIFRDNGRFIIGSLSWKGINIVLRKFKNFPIYYLPSNAVNTLSTYLPLLLFGGFFSPATVGAYALAVRVLQVPASFLGGAIAQVFHEKAASAVSDGTLPVLVKKTFGVLAGIGLYPTILTGMFSVELFKYIFGDAWSIAGVYAAILSPWIAMSFVSSPLSILTAVLNLQKLSLFFSTITFITRIISIAIGVYCESLTVGLILFSLSGLLIYLAKCLIVNFHAQVSLSESMYIILRASSWLLFPMIYLFVAYNLGSDKEPLVYLFGYILFGAGWAFSNLKALRTGGVIG